MKWSVLAVFASILPATAMAWPRVGDDARFDLNVQGAPVPISGSTELSVTSIDAGSDRMTVHVKVVISGYPQQQDSVAKLSDVQKLAANMPNLLAHCAENHGVAETITTAAGTFPCCRLPSVDGGNEVQTWYTDVPFGWAKQTRYNTQSKVNQVQTLVSYKNGQ